MRLLILVVGIIVLAEIIMSNQRTTAMDLQVQIDHMKKLNAEQNRRLTVAEDHIGVLIGDTQ